MTLMTTRMPVPLILLHYATKRHNTSTARAKQATLIINYNFNFKLFYFCCIFHNKTISTFTDWKSTTYHFNSTSSFVHWCTCCIRNSTNFDLTALKIKLSPLNKPYSDNKQDRRELQIRRQLSLILVPV